jgi:diadenosine tetraphosphatase ApaH/serine/threonine PP2A family protein phosphatase
MKHYDIIGDVHGHASRLEKLLEKLGYRDFNGYYCHPERRVVFVGDLIDRGNENFKTLEMVKAMVDNGQALIVMGNHEFNALCYHTRGSDGNYLRPHNEKNFRQHKKVLEEIEQRGENAWQIYLEWFRRMPLFLAMDGFRVVHACWDRQAAVFAGSREIRDMEGRVTDTFLVEASKKGTEAYDVVEILLKGKEILLPRDHPGLYDKDQNLRKRVRVKWWLTPGERETVTTYDQVTRIDEKNLEKLADVEIPPEILKELREDTNVVDRTPVFVGHYWFTGTPQPLTENVACLDYSVALGGHLVCYRWDGEQVLQQSKFVLV